MQKSAATSRSCISSMTTCVTSSSPCASSDDASLTLSSSSSALAVPNSPAPALLSRRRSTPFVTNIRLDCAPPLVSSRTLYPTSSPAPLNPRSRPTRSATDMAETRLGCVHSTRHRSPRSHASSRMNCGTCVVLPHPVSPTTTVTADCLIVVVSVSRYAATGSFAADSTIGAVAGEILAALLRLSS